MQWTKPKIMATAACLLGALGFMLLLPGAFWWAGFGCAALAIILGWRGIKQPGRFEQAASLAGISLALLFALGYILVAFFGER